MAQSRKTTASDQTGVATKKPARKARARAHEIQPDAVAERAYLMWLREPGATPEENWLRAEQELLAS
jgi:hypothetical protein